MTPEAATAFAGALDAEAAKRLARHADAAIRQALAARPDLAPELLFFLAADPDAGVRGAVAGNAATPGRADDLLAADGAPAVRVRLAEKAAARLPRPTDGPDPAGDGSTDPGPLDRLTRRVIERLADDPSAAVRKALSEALAELAEAPAAAVRRLAEDPEDPVAGPVLGRSPQLSEADLVALAASAPAPGARRAIAGRPMLTARVADAVAASGDPAAIAVLLANGGAHLREATLDRLLDAAPGHPDWHAPFVRRPMLTDGAVARLAGFVARALVEELAARPDLGPDAAAAVAERARRDIDADPSTGRRPVETPVSPSSAVTAPGPGPCGPEATAAPVAPETDPEDALDGAILAGDRRAVVAALSRAADLSARAVERVLATRSPGAVAALARRAGLPMRLASKVQLRIAGIPAAKAWVAGPDGGYPADDATLARLLDVALGDAPG